MIAMNENNTLETNETDRPSEPVTVYHYDSAKNLSTMKASYENELAAMSRTQPKQGDDHDNRGTDGPSFKTLFASFLVGAMLIGGLSYAADKQNLFSGNAGTTTSASGAPSKQNSGVVMASVGTSGNIADVYEKANPAVVKIENYASQTNSARNGTNFLFGGRGNGQQRQQLQQRSSEPVLTGSGTGFFFNIDGYILTNEHVVADAAELKVTVHGYDEPLTAKVVGSSYELDLAVLKVDSPDGKTFPALTLGDSDQASIGDWVIAIGNPYGLDHTITMGVLSAKERPITIADEQGEHKYEHLLQTDASINSGNSGGPLLNEQGEVIGINTAVNSEAQGIGFAIPTSTIKNVLEELLGSSQVKSF
ncbi:trypsin-like serine protease [Cohnella cholangitidis]|uniref:Trypsin-like serine protease n=2 Tax=Cohnella cholangitidis TaxID=2598458 RepID=A0A7G5BWC2_9BACL|nr:trypsin-like serine protease [Cohnella cholangitidis]